ncbi:hypothetical protein [Edaphobacter dinghuensis]|uniref:hypothetical protein n=1 Tax=Edaphobacter dinghuensis TaxID=1560005 RepID=UPI001667DFF7|nr:hypothetical protein [Edaphobacter dinghuensis]
MTTPLHLGAPRPDLRTWVPLLSSHPKPVILSVARSAKSKDPRLQSQFPSEAN